MHRRQRNVQGIGPGTLGKSGERLEFGGKYQCALGNIDQRQNTGDCEPAFRRLVIALARRHSAHGARYRSASETNTVCPARSVIDAPMHRPDIRMDMNTKVRSILRELKLRLAALYGERLRGVYLFGSYARNEANEESDADILIVLDRVENYSREIDTTSELTSELSLEHGISLSRVFATEEQWRTGQTNFFQNLREEAVPA